MATRKNRVSDVMRGMGVGHSIMKELENATEALGLPLEVLHLLATPEGAPVVGEMVATMAESLDQLGRLLGRYSITVDKALTVEEMISAGCFDWENADITSGNFPLELTDTREAMEVVTLCFDQDAPASGQDTSQHISTHKVLAAMSQKNLRPATIAETLALGAQHRSVQRIIPVVCLGSTCVFPHTTTRYCPVLCSDGSDRKLDLRFFDHNLGQGWSRDCRFLAVRKVA